jgi:hypothetical protein
MFGRCLFVGMCASIGTAALAAQPALSESDVSKLGERLHLRCIGTTITGDQPPPGNPVMADGLIDFAARRVSGFGVGSHPILVLTASDIGFGSTPPEGAPGYVVEGSIDRRSGGTHVRVRKQQEPAEVLIELRLDCEVEQPVS